VDVFSEQINPFFIVIELCDVNALAVLVASEHVLDFALRFFTYSW
jgi:hypothetical protein